MTFRRIVTGHNSSGASIIVGEEQVPFIETTSSSVAQVWVTESIPATNEGNPQIAEAPLSLQPPYGGAKLWIVKIPPKGDATDVSTTDDLKRHSTVTVDYLIVLSGEIDLIMDDGRTTLRQNDILIQRGTAHAWENLGHVPAVLAVVLIDAQPLLRAQDVA